MISATLETASTTPAIIFKSSDLHRDGPVHMILGHGGATINEGS